MKKFKANWNKRKTASERGYNYEWVKYRARFLKHNPKCYVCAANTKVVDHIRAHKGDEDLFWNKENHMPLCELCHNIITGKFDRYEDPKTEEKCKWVQEQRKMRGVTVRIKVMKNRS